MRRIIALVLLSGAFASTSCTRKAGEPSAPAVPASSFTDASTGAQIHAALLTPGSDTLYAAESKPPTTAEGWTAVEAGAAKVVEGAALMQTGLRPTGRAEWVRIAKAVQDNAEKSAEAARNKNADALAAADGDFTTQCEDCHNAFRDKGGGMMSKP
jgi:hypothetical protein